MLNLSKTEYPFSVKTLALEPEFNYTYLDEGDNRDKPCLLMVHGNPTWSFYYRNLVKAFSKEFRCVVPDHIGCGQSDKPQQYNYTLKQHIDNLVKLVEHLDLKKITLVIHDWGGAIGMGLATRFPDRIKGLVILNTAAFFSERIPFSIQICKLPVIGTFINRCLNGFAYPATFMAVAKGKKLSPQVAKSFIAPYNNWNNRVAVDAFVKDIPKKEGDASWNTLKEIEGNLGLFNKIPKLILWGGQDFCFNDSFYKKWLDIYPDAEKKYFNEGGHYILEDCLEEVTQCMQTFLSKQNLPKK